MDPDSDANKTINNTERNIPDVSNVLLAIWLRCNFCDHNEIYKFVLDYGCNFLPYIGVIFYILFYITILS